MDINVVDLIALDEENKIVNLIMMDERNWVDNPVEFHDLQERLLEYVAVIESGSLYKHYPQINGYDVMIHVVYENTPTAEGELTLQELQAVLSDTGYMFTYTIMTDN